MIILLYLFYIIPMLYGLSVFIRIINNEYNNEYTNLSYNEIFLMFLFALFPFVNFNI